MKYPITRLIAAVLFTVACSAAAGQTYPDKPITLLVPFPPGASADGVARILGRQLSVTLGKPVVVENRPGGGGTSGLITLAHAAPDGYTLGIGATGAIAVNRHLPDAAPLDPDKQLAPVAKVADIPLVFIASQKSGMRSLQDAAILAQRAKEGLSYGTAGQFTSQHLAGELYAKVASISMTAVPYRGSTPALTDVIAGQIPLAVVDLTSASPHIKSGRVTALAVTGPARAKAAPDIPTVAEKGYAGYAASGWLGMFAPAGTPPQIVAKVAGALKDALTDPKVSAEMTMLATEPAYLAPDAFGRYISSESRKWGDIISGMGKKRP